MSIQLSFIKQEINKLPIPSDLIMLIFHYLGYVKILKNGKYMYIYDKCPVYSRLTNVLESKDKLYPTVRLHVKTKWLRHSFCDKIITIYTILYNDFRAPIFERAQIMARAYDCSWYEYDECNACHHIITEEKQILYENLEKTKTPLEEYGDGDEEEEEAIKEEIETILEEETDYFRW